MNAASSGRAAGALSCVCPAAARLQRGREAAATARSVRPPPLADVSARLHPSALGAGESSAAGASVLPWALAVSLLVVSGSADRARRSQRVSAVLLAAA